MSSDTPARRGRRVSHWEVTLVVAVGLGLMKFGWSDIRAYHRGRGRPDPTFSLVDSVGGVRVGATEVYRNHDGHSVRLENFSGVENGEHFFRHALGPTSTLEISTRGTHAELKVRHENPFEDQGITVVCNGVTLEQLEHLSQGVVTRHYALDLRPGVNVVTFTYRRYNHDGTLNLPEGRPFGGTFLALDLFLE